MFRVVDIFTLEVVEMKGVVRVVQVASQGCMLPILMQLKQVAS
jgi:hypothetical protein